MPNVMQREPVSIPRKPGVFALINSKSCRCGYVAFTSDLQKRSHSLAHMLQNQKTHWTIRDLPKAPAGEWTFTLIDTTPNLTAAERLITHTKKTLLARRYRVIEGARGAAPLVNLDGKQMPLTEAIRVTKCRTAYITVWRRLDRGWSLAQALDLEDPPVRWDPDDTKERRRRAARR